MYGHSQNAILNVTWENEGVIDDKNIGLHKLFIDIHSYIFSQLQYSISSTESIFRVVLSDEHISILFHPEYFKGK